MSPWFVGNHPWRLALTSQAAIGCRQRQSEPRCLVGRPSCSVPPSLRAHPCRRPGGRRTDPPPALVPLGRATHAHTHTDAGARSRAGAPLERGRRRPVATTMLRPHTTTECSRASLRAGGMPDAPAHDAAAPPLTAAGAPRPRSHAQWPARAAPSAATSAGPPHCGAAATAGCDRAQDARPAHRLAPLDGRQSRDDGRTHSRLLRDAWWPGSRTVPDVPHGTLTGSRRPIPALDHSLLAGRFSASARQDHCSRTQHGGRNDAGSAAACLATEKGFGRKHRPGLTSSSSQSCLLARLSNANRAKPLSFLLVLSCFCCTSITGAAASSPALPVTPKFMWDVEVLICSPFSLAQAVVKNSRIGEILLWLRCLSLLCFGVCGPATRNPQPETSDAYGHAAHVRR